MKLYARTVIASLFLVTIAATVDHSARATSPAPCSMAFVNTGPEFSKSTLVGLGTALPESASAPGGLNGARGNPELGRRTAPRAWRFSLSDVPRELIETHRAVLKKASGHVWVVPWFRTPSCQVESSWLDTRDPKLHHAVLFLTPRPESLWVNGEPTFDTFDGEFSPHMIWEHDSKSENPAPLRELRIFLAVYPRLAGFTAWREGSFMAWALAHRDSGNAIGLRGRLQELMSPRICDSLEAIGSPLAGDWRGEGALRDGDSLHFWMRIPSGPSRFVWANGWGWYSGPARFDSIPLPTYYELAVAFARVRDSLPAVPENKRDGMSFSLGRSDSERRAASWSFLARFGPEERRAAFMHQQAIQGISTNKLAGERPVWLEQTQRVNASHDTIWVTITSRDTAIAHWIAHRVK
jgi:hypothetical protein